MAPLSPSLALCFLCLIKYSIANRNLEALNKALEVTDATLNRISEKWEIKKYPNFLRSVAMTHTSWEVLKVKYEQKILNGFINPSKSQTLILSFTGSSVTAGNLYFVMYKYN